MENSNKIIPPHLNAEVYRTDTTGTSTLSYLDYIRIHSDGSILVGCSELTGRYWNGGACIFNNVPEDYKLISEKKKSIYLDSGTADGCFIQNSNKVLLCEDNGTVSVWTTNEDAWKQWTDEISITEHDNIVMAVDCLEPGNKYVTVGADGNIKVWDVSEMLCIRNYDAAHSLAIYGVSAKPNSTTTFATCSLDHYVTLWDDNISKPVLDLAKNNCGVRCLQWVDENRLVYGDEAGILNLVDARNPEDTLRLAEFPAAVHKLAINSESSKVGVCCDNKIVSVCSIDDNNKSQVVYSDRHMHNNYVRGLVWDIKDTSTLYALGWDGQIKTHKISND